VQYDQRHLQGRYAYDAHPDTQLTLDQNSRIKRVTDYVNFLAKSPWVSQGDMARLVTGEFGYDASRLVKAPQPPPPPPPPHPNVSLALKAQDLGIPEVQLVLKQLGIQLPPTPSPELALSIAQEQAKNQPHGGGAAKADLVDKHHSDITGNQVGKPPMEAPPAPQVAPGNMVQ
jgi:hypothetical protein